VGGRVGVRGYKRGDGQVKGWGGGSERLGWVG
jgi:hypothetical protein